MKTKVLKVFENKYQRGKYFTPGQIVEFEEGRAKDLIARGLAEEVTEIKESPKAKESEKK